MEIKKFGDRERSTINTGTHSHVQQNLMQETDINRIMAKYQKTGVLTHVNQNAGLYGDFSDVQDYKSGLERIMAADDLFLSLPATIRDRFKNDPAAFIDFALDPNNNDEMQKMGLAPKKAKAVEDQPKDQAKAVADPPKEAPKP